MKFQTKIFFATLFILTTTLTLNSILSTSSFENIYRESLLSTYKVGGGILKRKIDQSLKFGKPLSHFKGMDKLLKEFILENRYIEFAGIVNVQKEILYHSDKDKKGSFIKNTLPLNNYKTTTSVTDSHYITFIPLSKNKGKTIAGFLFFGFNHSVINNKIQDMTIHNLKSLSVLIIITGIILIFFLGITIVKPLKKAISDMSLNLSKNTINKAEQENKKDPYLTSSALEKTHLSYFEIYKIKNEIWQLALFFKYFKISYSNKINELNELQYELDQTASEIKKITETNEDRMKKYLIENKSDFKISSLYKYIKNQDTHIKKLIKLCSILFSKENKSENIQD